MRLGLIRCVAGAMAAMLACSSDATPGETETAGSETDTSTGGTTGEVVEFADFFVRAEEAYCSWAARCGGFTSEEDCREAEFFDVLYPQGLLGSGYFDDGYNGGQAVAYLRASHEAGRIEFDGAAAASCLAWVEARGCQEPGVHVPDEAEAAAQAACSALMRGTTVQNGPCLLSLECAPLDNTIAVCGFAPTCSDACCVGGCRNFGAVAIGSPCTNQTRCETGSFCASDPNSGLPTVCTAQRPVGAACLNGSECGDDSYCNFETGKCQAPGAEGEKCDAFGDDSCQPGLFCADPGYLGNGRCYAYTSLGEACPSWHIDGCGDLGVGCAYDSATCVELPGPGAPCGDTSEGQCGPTTDCNWETNKCAAKAGLGEPCGVVSCAGALRCDGWDVGEARCRAPEVSTICAVPGDDDLPEGT